VGRGDELLTLAHWFDKPGGRAFAISGVRGEGKTALALNAARRYAYRFHAVAFASAKGVPDFCARGVLEALNAALGQTNAPGEAGDAIAQHMNGGPVLLVLDSLETVAPARTVELAQALERVDPLGGSRVLMTLRLPPPDRLAELAGNDHLVLRELDPPSALRILWNGLSENWEAVRRQIGPLGSLPPGAARRLEALAQHARLPRWLARTEVAALDEMAALAFRHAAMVNLAAGMVRDQGWERTRQRLEGLREREVEQALDELIGQERISDDE
jgi:hypothetical protein